MFREDHTVGSVYSAGLPNSTGAPAELTAEGSADLLLNDLELLATGLPEGQFGYCLASRTQGSSFPPGSQGQLCLGGAIARFNAGIGIGPSFRQQVDLTAIPLSPPANVLPGETWSFQCWYRDQGGASQFSSAVQVPFL